MERDLLEHILDVSCRMAETRTLSPLLNYVVDEAIKLVGAERGYIVLVQSDDSLDFRVKRDQDGRELENAEDQVSRTVLSQVISTGQSLVLRDAQQDPRFKGAESVVILGLRSIMCVPLVSRGETIGAIYVENRSIRGRFSDDDIVPLVLFANQAAVDIENARLFQALQEAHDQLEMRVEERTVELSKANALLKQEITERKQAEEALRESEERLRSLFETMAEGVILIAPEGQIVQANPAAERILGLTRSEIESRNYVAPEWEILRLDGTPMPAEEMAGPRAMKEKLPVKDVVMGVKRPDGSIFWINVSAAPLISEAGKLEGVVGTFVDVTERVRAEEQLQRYTAELEQANEEIKRFAYIISHDLRAPLVNLKGFAAELRSALEVIGSAMDTALPYLDEKQQQVVTTAFREDIGEALGFIDSSVTRVDRFISALLRLSRLGRRELDLEPIDMNVLVQATLQSLSHQIEERRVKVTVGSLPEVLADRISMELIMGNLLTNAVLYLDPDRPGEIEVIGECDRDETTFRVRDSGRGIAEEDMGKVFAPFRRAGRQDVSGEGMGLSYVQTLVRRHGGRIWCESEPGVGTTFTFTLSNHLAEGDDYV